MSFSNLRPHCRERKGNDGRDASEPPDNCNHAFCSLYVHLYLQNPPHLCSCTFSPSFCRWPLPECCSRLCSVHYRGFCLEIGPEPQIGVSALIPKAAACGQSQMKCFSGVAVMIAEACGNRWFPELHFRPFFSLDFKVPLWQNSRPLPVSESTAVITISSLTLIHQLAPLDPHYHVSILHHKWWKGNDDLLPVLHVAPLSYKLILRLRGNWSFDSSTITCN